MFASTVSIGTQLEPRIERQCRWLPRRQRRVRPFSLVPARGADLGICFGATLTQAELCYLMTQEWARTADDVLWRHTKLGLAPCPTNQIRLLPFGQSGSLSITSKTFSLKRAQASWRRP